MGLLLGGFGRVLAAESGDYSDLLKAQVARYPEMQPADCYKLLFQGCLGSEHAAGDPAMVSQWLEKELASMGPGPDEPVIDPITPDGHMVRVHLRAFVRRRGDAARLALAFVQTAGTQRGSRAALAAAWEQVIRLAAAGRLPFTAEAARKFGDEMAAAGYPAVHHSDKYTRLYRPAYRVIAREFLPGLMADQ